MFEGDRPLALARTVGSWAAGTRVQYVGNVQGHVPEFEATAVVALCDKKREIIYVDDRDLVQLRPRDGLTKAQR